MLDKVRSPVGAFVYVYLPFLLDEKKKQLDRMMINIKTIKSFDDKKKTFNFDYQCIIVWSRFIYFTLLHT